MIVNEEEAKTVNHIFEMYLKCGSLFELSEALSAERVVQKKWITAGGKTRGGNKFTSSMVQRLLRERVYIGDIENKKTKSTFKGQHSAIIAKELWDAVQKKLEDNNYRKTDDCRSSQNILVGKLFDGNGSVFTNQATSRRRTITKRYYAIKGLYLPAEQVEELAKTKIQEILNSKLDGLKKDIALALKQISFDNMDYFHQRDFINIFINKIIYTNNKMTLFLNLNKKAISSFITADFINQKLESCDYTVDEVNDQIIVERLFYFKKGQSSNVYNAGKVGLMTIAENQQLIVRALAYAWKYKNLYERGVLADKIAKTENISKRTIYKYLNLAYLSPRIINVLMSGTKTTDLQKLFEIASKYERFDDQEKAFY